MATPASELASLATVAVRDLSRAQDDTILADEKLWQVVSSGDLKGLTPKQKSDYYLYRCRQEGLNPASQPFQYVTFQGKETLYAGKVAADQLRKLHGVSITSVSCKDDGEIIECEVRVRGRDGREDVEFGTVFVGQARGVERANAKMKCLTKAKRRATFSICGTGVLDETEVETIPGVRFDAPLDVPERHIDDDEDIIDAETGEIVQESFAPPPAETAHGRMTREQNQIIKDVVGRLGWDKARVQSFAGEVTGITNASLLSEKQAKDLIQHLLAEMRPETA